MYATPTSRRVTRPAAFVAALALLPLAAQAASVGFLPVDDTLPASSHTGVGLHVTEDRGRFHLTFTNASTLGSSSLKIVFEDGFAGLLGQPIALESVAADFTNRTPLMPRQPGTFADAGWTGVSTLLAARRLEAENGLGNARPDTLTVSFLKRGHSMSELLTALESVGTRIGVVIDLDAGGRVAMATQVPVLAPPVEPPPAAAVPNPAAAAMGLALLATQCAVRRHRRR